MGTGFEVAVGDLRDAAKGPLPSLETTLRWTAIQLFGREAPTGEGYDASGEYAATWNAFVEHCWEICRRQSKGADAIAATGDALMSIASLYAKADGQE